MDDTGPARPRLAPRSPTDLGESGRDVYDRIIASRSQGRTSPFPLIDADGALTGPFNAMVAAPHVGGPLADLGAALRYTGHLSNRARELSILTVAARSRSEFEWQSHFAIAKSLGIADDILGAIRAGDDPMAITDAVERAVVAASISLIADGDLGEIEFAELVELIDEDGVIELVVLVGYYELLARLLRVLKVPATTLGPDRTTGA
jgi:4-carboxymuconolactone decarboxylase